MAGKKIYKVPWQDLKSISFKVHKNIHEILSGKNVQTFLFRFFAQMWGDLTPTRKRRYNKADLKLLDMLLDPAYALGDIEDALNVFHQQKMNRDKPSIYQKMMKEKKEEREAN